jgi:hypothetical protein
MNGGIVTDCVANLKCVGFGKYNLPVLINVKLSPPYNLPGKTEGECMYSFTLSLTSALYGGAKRHAPTALSP